MRDPRELLALLTAKIQRFQVAPGGIPAITPEDMAHTLGIIYNDNARLYARLKYCGESTYGEGLALCIRRHIMNKKLDGSWRVPRKEFLLELSYLILAEAVDPNVCSWCKGRGEVAPETGPVITCGGCQGGGRKAGPMLESDRARLLGLTRQAWNNTWSDRYKEVQAETVDKWEEVVRAAIKKRLRA